MFAGKLFFDNVLENMLRITHQRNGRPHVLADLRRIHIDMHQNLVFRYQIRLAHRPVRNSRADHDKQIGFVHRPVGTGLAVITHHAVIHGMFRRHNADAHHRRNDRNAVFFRKSAQLSFRTAEQHAAARADNRPFCLRQLSDHFFDLNGMSSDRRFIGAQVYVFRINEFL